MVVEGAVVCRSSVVGVGVRSVVAESARREQVGLGRSVFFGVQVQKMGAGMSARSGERPAAVPSASGGAWPFLVLFIRNGSLLFVIFAELMPCPCKRAVRVNHLVEIGTLSSLKLYPVTEPCDF